jgi:hypothetical protein
MRTTSFVSMLCAVAFACGGNHGKTVDSAIDSPIDSPHDGPGSGSGSNTAITVTFTNPPANASDFDFRVGFEDGSAAWQDAPSPSGGTYTLEIASASYGVAFTCIDRAPAGSGSALGSANGSNRNVFLAEAATAEQPTLSITLPARCTDPIPTVTLSGTISNAPLGGKIDVFVGSHTGSPGAATAKYSLVIEPGMYDLVAVHTPGTLGSAAPAPDKILVQRGITVGATDTTVNLDFANAKAPQEFTATITGAGSADVAVASTLDANNTGARLFAQGQVGGGAFSTYMLNAADALGTDLYQLGVLVAGTGVGARSIVGFATTLTATTLQTPAPLGGVLSSVPTSTPYPEVALQWIAYANAIGYVASAHQGPCDGTGICVTWSAALSTTVAGASPKFQMPDLTGLTGWDTRLQFVTGTQVSGAVTGETSTAGTSDFYAPGLPASGTTRTTASAGYTTIP